MVDKSKLSDSVREYIETLEGHVEHLRTQRDSLQRRNTELLLRSRESERANVRVLDCQCADPEIICACFEVTP